jgi:hypothetical protein
MEVLLDQKQRLLQRAAELRAKIGGRKMPRIPEPARKKVHWDYVIEEMQWLSAEVLGERRHKQARAYMLVHEVVGRLETQAKKRLEAEAQKRELSSQLADCVQSYFASIQDKMKRAVKQFIKTTEWAVEAEPQHEQGHFLYFTKAIHLEEVPAPIESKATEKPVDLYVKRVIQEFGFGNSPIIEAVEERASSHEGQQDTTSTASESIVPEFHSQLYYEVEDYSQWEQELKRRFDSLQIEDFPTYGPPSVNDKEFIHMLAADDFKDMRFFDLLPNAEELSMWETTKKLQQESMSPGSSLVRIMSPSADFLGGLEGDKKDWRVFEDMHLEKCVMEFGGNWDLVSDLMQISEYTGSDLFTPKICERRWRYLQKLKGRQLKKDYVPQSVLCDKLHPVQDIPSKFSLKSIQGRHFQVAPTVSTTSRQVSAENPFQFLLSNINPEDNLYLYHYKALNEGNYASRNPMLARLTPKPPKALDMRRLLKEPETEDREEILNINFSVSSAKASVGDKRVSSMKVVPKPYRQATPINSMQRSIVNPPQPYRIPPGADPRSVGITRHRLASEASTAGNSVRSSRRSDDPNTSAFETPAIPDSY